MGERWGLGLAEWTGIAILVLLFLLLLTVGYFGHFIETRLVYGW
jgi:hypothetical protein